MSSDATLSSDSEPQVETTVSAAPLETVPERTFLAVVDNSDEMEVAIRFVSRRARHSGGRVALVYVVEPADQAHWVGVGELMREEARQEAEMTLQRYASLVKDLSGKMPVLHIREGAARDEIIGLVNEEPSISVIVLAAAADGGNPGPLVSEFSGRFLGKLGKPMTIIPGHLTNEQIDAIS